LEAHRPQQAQDAECDCYEARLKILRGKPAEAVELFRQGWQKLPDHERRRAADDFLRELAGYEQGLAAYRCLPDKIAAFQQLAWRYRQPKHVKQFALLIDE